ncbi:MAG: biopolymer transporter ExbD [Holophagaceae bacterium]|nr:biopolymer transporter ExbD [Holophagaceae bacterium]
MDAGGAKGKQKSDINVTPLIDIVLVLLIVFIVMVPGLDKATKVVVPQVVNHDSAQTRSQQHPDPGRSGWDHDAPAGQDRRAGPEGSAPPRRSCSSPSATARSS